MRSGEKERERERWKLFAKSTHNPHNPHDVENDDALPCRKCSSSAIGTEEEEENKRKTGTYVLNVS